MKRLCFQILIPHTRPKQPKRTSTMFYWDADMWKLSNRNVIEFRSTHVNFVPQQLFLNDSYVTCLLRRNPNNWKLSLGIELRKEFRVSPSLSLKREIFRETGFPLPFWMKWHDRQYNIDFEWTKNGVTFCSFFSNSIEFLFGNIICEGFRNPKERERNLISFSSRYWLLPPFPFGNLFFFLLFRDSFCFFISRVPLSHSLSLRMIRFVREGKQSATHAISGSSYWKARTSWFGNDFRPTVCVYFLACKQGKRSNEKHSFCKIHCEGITRGTTCEMENGNTTPTLRWCPFNLGSCSSFNYCLVLPPSCIYV